MRAAGRKLLAGVLLVLWVLLCGEVAIRVISAFTDIYTVEMLKYAKTLKTRSAIPGLSHEHVANASATLMGVEVSLNGLGHRSRPLANPKDARERRIHVLGSSIALGWGVASGQDFVALLEKRLNAELGPKTGLRYVGVNAGIGNYNTVYEVALFEKQVDVTDPDVVVLQYYVNDAEPNPRGENNFILRHSVLAAIVYQHVKTIRSLMAKPLGAYYAGLYADGQESWTNARSAVRELRDLCAARHIKLIAVLVPELHDLREDGPYPPIYAKIAAMFAGLGVPMIDTLPRIRATFADDPRGAWVASDDPHPSAAVHRLIADALFEFLAAEKL